MNDLYKKAKNVFEKELERVVDKGDLSPTNLEFSYKLVDIIKDIGEICEKEDIMYEDDYSGRRGYSMRHSRYYPYMGEYAVEGTYGRGYSGEGYRRSNTSSMKASLQQLLNEASNEHERMMIQRWMDEVN